MPSQGQRARTRRHAWVDETYRRHAMGALRLMAVPGGGGGPAPGGERFWSDCTACPSVVLRSSSMGNKGMAIMQQDEDSDGLPAKVRGRIAMVVCLPTGGETASGRGKGCPGLTVDQKAAVSARGRDTCLCWADWCLPRGVQSYYLRSAQKCERRRRSKSSAFNVHGEISRQRAKEEGFGQHWHVGFELAPQTNTAQIRLSLLP